MAVSDKPWGDITQADYPDAKSFCAASLVDANGPGDKTKGNCSLPVYEPSGALNRNGVHAAAARLAGAGGGVNITPDQRRMAAKKLIELYRELQETPPEAIRRMAQ